MRAQPANNSRIGCMCIIFDGRWYGPWRLPIADAAVERGKDLELQNPGNIIQPTLVM